MTIVFIIIILPVVLTLATYIGYEIRTINRQNQYNTGLISATHDAIFSFELNTKNDNYRANPEKKRTNIKAAVKTFENSLSNSCGLGLYNNNAIEQYIPAMGFFLYDGFYMYAPYKVGTDTGSTTYKHNLKNYVYYSEKIGNDIVINYTLDNYVSVSGTFGGQYMTRSGYLMADNGDMEKALRGVSTEKTVEFQAKTTPATRDAAGNVVTAQQNVVVPLTLKSDNAAQNYVANAKAFTYWFKQNVVRAVPSATYLNINDSTNDPEEENSPFVQHKQAIMKNKIQDTLNTAIIAYSTSVSTGYKMPNFSEEDWQKIYQNIAVATFVQGMHVGFRPYNNYCILNSTNNQEYVNPDLIYFSDGNQSNPNRLSSAQYHDIRCTALASASNITGYRAGSFEKVNRELSEELTPPDTNYTRDNAHQYYYKHRELACYDCINGSVKTQINPSTNKAYTVREYVKSKASETVKKAYYRALARERWNTVKLLDRYEEAYDSFNTPFKDFMDTELTAAQAQELMLTVKNSNVKYPTRRIKINGSNILPATLSAGIYHAAYTYTTGQDRAYITNIYKD